MLFTFFSTVSLGCVMLAVAQNAEQQPFQGFTAQACPANFACGAVGPPVVVEKYTSTSTSYVPEITKLTETLAVTTTDWVINVVTSAIGNVGFCETTSTKTIPGVKIVIAKTPSTAIEHVFTTTRITKTKQSTYYSTSSLPCVRDIMPTPLTKEAITKTAPVLAVETGTGEEEEDKEIYYDALDRT